MCDACKRHHLGRAQAMKERFPDLLAPYTAKEVQEIWEWYSEEYMAAGWIGVQDDEDEELVRRVFTELYHK